MIVCFGLGPWTVRSVLWTYGLSRRTLVLSGRIVLASKEPSLQLTPIRRSSEAESVSGAPQGLDKWNSERTNQVGEELSRDVLENLL